MGGFITGNFVHAMQVYTTVIVENHAGLTSLFEAKEPLIIDHTGPHISDVIASASVLYVNESGELVPRVQVNATWEVVDDESGVKHCACSVGKYH